jgi:hypothetical protein
LKREYFTACVVVLFTAVIGLLAPDSTGQPPIKSQLSLFFIAIIGVMAVNLFFKFKRTNDPATDETLIPQRSRLFRMTLLWYALSLALASPVAFRPAKRLWLGQTDLVSNIEWVLGAASVGIVIFSLLRIFNCLFKADTKSKLG